MKLRMVLSCLLSISSIPASALNLSRFESLEDRSPTGFFPRPQGVLPTSPIVTSSKKVIPVVLYVITDDAGRGNDKWLTDDYTGRVIEEVNNYFGSDVVTFRITQKNQVRSTERYGWSQKKLLDKYDSKDKRGQVTVVISSETYDGRSSGITHGRLDSEPMFVMRSRFNSLDQTDEFYFDSDKAIKKTARLFIHEFGHEMGLQHKTQIRPSKGEVLHTENFVEPGKDGNVDGKGRIFYEHYFRKCLATKSWFCRMGSIK